MKKTVILVTILFAFSLQFVKPQEMEDIQVKFIDNIPTSIEALPSSNALKDYVQILTVGLDDGSGPSSLSVIKSRTNATTEMLITAANISNTDAVIRVEFELRYNDGYELVK